MRHNTLTGKVKRAPAWLCAVLVLLADTSAFAGLPIQSWTAKSGARVLFVEARTIPMIDVNLDLDAGSRYDPPGKSGLAAMTQGLLALGAGGLSEQQIADRLADTGAQRGGRIDLDRAGLSMRTLSSAGEREAAIATLASMAGAPAFSAEVLGREKARRVSAIGEEDTKPAIIADRAFDLALYGDHPYGRNQSAASIDAITRDDVAAFHAANYAARRAVVTIIGDLARAEAEDIAERITARLPAGSPPPLLPAVPPARASETRLPHPATQSHIMIGSAVLKRADPDYFPLLVGNYILGGGGFVSRLMSEVREKRGLAYSVYSYFTPLAQEGPFLAGMQTRKEQSAEAVALVRRMIAEYVLQGPTAKELKAAKDNLVDGFALRIDNNRKILDNVAAIGWYGLPLDYLDTWTTRVARVSVADVKAALTRRLKPEQFAVVVVGAPEQGPGVAPR